VSGGGKLRGTKRFGMVKPEMKSGRPCTLKSFGAVGKGTVA